MYRAVPGAVSLVWAKLLPASSENVAVWSTGRSPLASARRSLAAPNTYNRPSRTIRISPTNAHPRVRGALGC